MQLVGRFANLVLFLCLVTAGSSYSEQSSPKDSKSETEREQVRLDNLLEQLGKVQESHDKDKKFDEAIQSSFRRWAAYDDRAKVLNTSILKLLDRANANGGRLRGFDDNTVNHLERLSHELEKGGPSYDGNGILLSRSERHEILNKASVLVQFLTTLFEHAEKLTPEELDKVEAYSRELSNRESFEHRLRYETRVGVQGTKPQSMPSLPSRLGLSAHPVELQNQMALRAAKLAHEARLKSGGAQNIPAEPSLSKLTNSELVNTLNQLDPWIVAYNRSSIGPREAMQMPIEEVFQVQSKKSRFSDYLSSNSFVSEETARMIELNRRDSESKDRFFRIPPQPAQLRGPLSGGF